MRKELTPILEKAKDHYNKAKEMLLNRSLKKGEYELYEENCDGSGHYFVANLQITKDSNLYNVLIEIAKKYDWLASWYGYNLKIEPGNKVYNNFEI